jgi:hypothetical protein
MYRAVDMSTEARRSIRGTGPESALLVFSILYQTEGPALRHLRGSREGEEEEG